jgi:hypothetical protein
MRLIESQTSRNGISCVRFVPRNNEPTYLRIHSGQGCWSYVGKQKWNGEQLVSFEIPGCVNIGKKNVLSSFNVIFKIFALRYSCS